MSNKVKVNITGSVKKDGKFLKGIHDFSKEEAEKIVEANAGKIVEETSEEKSDIPNSKSKVDEIKSWLNAEKIDFPENAKKEELLKILENNL